MIALIILPILLAAAQAAPITSDTMLLTIRSENPFEEKGQVQGTTFNKIFLYTGVPLIAIFVIGITISVCAKHRRKQAEKKNAREQPVGWTPSRGVTSGA